MIKPDTVRVEEPLSENTDVDALDESSGKIVLANFSVDSIDRFIFTWPRGSSTSAIQFLIDLSLHEKILGCVVVGWRHDTRGSLTTRHKIMASKLVASGWDVSAREGVGLAVLPCQLESLETAIELASKLALGWFLVPSLTTARQISGDAFEPTLRSFCWTHRLTPSREFLSAMDRSLHAIAYVSNGDDRLPSVIVAVSKTNETVLARLQELAKEPLSRFCLRINAE